MIYQLWVPKEINETFQLYSGDENLLMVPASFTSWHWASELTDETCERMILSLNTENVCPLSAHFRRKWIYLTASWHGDHFKFITQTYCLCRARLSICLWNEEPGATDPDTSAPFWPLTTLSEVFTFTHWFIIFSLLLPSRTRLSFCVEWVGNKYSLYKVVMMADATDFE